jgi:hypothetical protein
VWEGEYVTNTVHVYVNAKMRPVETVPGMGRGEKENDGGGEFKYDIYCKNFCKCHNVPPHNNKKIQNKNNPTTTCLKFCH